MNSFTEFGTTNIVYIVFFVSVILSILWFRAFRKKTHPDEIPSDDYSDDDDKEEKEITIIEIAQIVVVSLLISSLVLIALNVIYLS